MVRGDAQSCRLIHLEYFVGSIEGNIEGCLGGGQLFPITLPSIDLEFPLEDGHTIEWDFDMLMVTGESSVTLHVP